MKHLSIILLSLMLTSFSPASSLEARRSTITTILACKYGQCTAIAKSTGNRCKNCCQKGSTTCYSHR